MNDKAKPVERVIGLDTHPDTFTAAMTIGEEAHLVDGGFVERVDPPPKPKATRKKKED